MLDFSEKPNRLNYNWQKLRALKDLYNTVRGFRENENTNFLSLLHTKVQLKLLFESVWS